MSVVTCRSCGTANTTFNAFCHECSGPLTFTGDGPKSAASAGYNRILFFEGTVVGRYEIKRLIGAGAAGEVYAAVERESGRDVALKFLSSDLIGDGKARERLQREARAVRALDHPGIAKVFEIAEGDGRPFIAMELHEGRALTDWFARGPVPLLELVRIGAEIASALRAAHGAGIVHRDVKPANVLLTAAGQVKLVDFGLAKVAPGADGTKLTRTGAVVGTVAYMAPEQLAGEVVDHRADLWSLGVLLYEGAFGRLPFWGQGLSRRILTDRPAGLDEPLPELPVGLTRLLSGLLEKDPRKRIQSASRVEEALRGLLPGAGKIARKSYRSAVLVSRAAVVAAVAFLAFAAYWKWRPVAPAPPPVSSTFVPPSAEATHAAQGRREAPAPTPSGTPASSGSAVEGLPAPPASVHAIDDDAQGVKSHRVERRSTHPSEGSSGAAAVESAAPLLVPSEAPPPTAPDPIGLPEKPF